MTAYKEVIVSYHRRAVEKHIKTKLEIQYLKPQTKKWLNIKTWLLYQVPYIWDLNANSRTIWVDIPKDIDFPAALSL